MRAFVALFSMLFLLAANSNAYAQDNKSQLYDQCMEYKRDASYCKCAMGKPYDELALTEKVYKNIPLEQKLEKLKKKYSALYDSEITRGGLDPSKINKICDVVDEYYVFLSRLGVPYYIGPRIDQKAAAAYQKGMRSLSSEQAQSVHLKRAELNKKMQKINHEYQRNGALGSGAALASGVCVVGGQIEWLKDKMNKEAAQATNAPVNVDIQKLLAQSVPTCGGY